ncbi:replication initiation protein [Siphonobacter aquaeclarae]|uniref:Initiator Replication protein n=1 Tax=Siphonobacter aquaeclarae TaxID=563176 RepID=A0A1G9IZ30_9BACT|nr:replication initiation protein [Siphonobacter aquaeclarae]SDL30519.1 Initiator Replication protein [Siphonobacter aquaeclarae]
MENKAAVRTNVRKKRKNNTLVLIRKSNALVEAHYKFTIWETRVFAKMVSMIDWEDRDFKEYKIYFRDIIRDFGLRRDGRTYEDLKEGARGLMSKIIKLKVKTDGIYETLETPIIGGIKTPDDVHRKIVQSKRLDDDRVYLKVSFHPDLKPFLIELKERYLVYEMANILDLSSPYTVRIYELLKQYEKLGERMIELQELKAMLGMEEEYKLYGHFRDRVLEKAKEDLQKYTDIRFEYEGVQAKNYPYELPVKLKSNAVVAIRFYNITKNDASRTVKQPMLKLKAPAAIPAEPAEVVHPFFDEIYSQVKDFVTEQTVAQWLEKAPIDHIRASIQATVKQLKKKNSAIQNVGGYLNTLILSPPLFVNPEATKGHQLKQERIDKEQIRKKNQEIVDQWKNKWYEKQYEVIQAFLSIRHSLRVELIQQAKKTVPFAFDPKLSDEQNYKDKMLFATAVWELGRQYCEDELKVVESQYLPRLRELERELLR